MGAPPPPPPLARPAFSSAWAPCTPAPRPAPLTPGTVDFRASPPAPSLQAAGFNQEASAGWLGQGLRAQFDQSDRRPLNRARVAAAGPGALHPPAHPAAEVPRRLRGCPARPGRCAASAALLGGQPLRRAAGRAAAPQSCREGSRSTYPPPCGHTLPSSQSLRQARVLPHGCLCI